MGGRDVEVNLFSAALQRQRPSTLRVGLRRNGDVFIDAQRDGKLIRMQMFDVPQNGNRGAVVNHIAHGQHGSGVRVKHGMRVERYTIIPARGCGIEHLFRANQARVFIGGLLFFQVFVHQCWVVVWHQHHQQTGAKNHHQDQPKSVTIHGQPAPIDAYGGLP